MKPWSAPAWFNDEALTLDWYKRRGEGLQRR